MRITGRREPFTGKTIRINKARITVLIPSKHEAIQARSGRLDYFPASRNSRRKGNSVFPSLRLG
ncbi:hypothetical protein BMS3Bbin10_02337 [bacterium BMS3Bbin10]|nr:hypothetical protein BMS3Bbin10_02337 [bacterium BMS3Bbin10]